MPVFQEDKARSHDVQLPLIGIYSCLLCEQHFSTKLQLNSHYREKHAGNIQGYEGEDGVLVIWITSYLAHKLRGFRDAYKHKDHQTE